jgi:hypothetical protein
VEIHSFAGDLPRVGCGVLAADEAPRITRLEGQFDRLWLNAFSCAVIDEPTCIIV